MFIRDTGGVTPKRPERERKIIPCPESPAHGVDRVFSPRDRRPRPATPGNGAPKTRRAEGTGETSDSPKGEG